MLYCNFGLCLRLMCRVDGATNRLITCLPCLPPTLQAHSHWSAKPKAEMWLALVDCLSKLARHHDVEVRAEQWSWLIRPHGYLGAPKLQPRLPD